MARGYLRPVLAYVAAVLTAAALGSVIQTQFNLAALARLGIDIPLPVRISTTLADLAGFAPRYAGLVAAAFAVAFALAELVVRLLGGWHHVVSVLAGIGAIAAALALMNTALPMTPIAAARSLEGIAALAVAGGIGGTVYHALATPPDWQEAGDS